MANKKSYTTVAQVLKIPLSNHKRDSNYCPKCHKKGGSSIGNNTYSQTACYHWWHCRNCGLDYDLVIQEHTLPPGMRAPLDNGGKKSKRKG